MFILTLGFGGMFLTAGCIILASKTNAVEYFSIIGLIIIGQLFINLSLNLL